LTPTAWHYFALFAAVIAALITEPLPGAAIGFIGVTLAASLLLVGKTPAELPRSQAGRLQRTLPVTLLCVVVGQ
jgi:L-tartrate/succinate antiporter